MARGWTPGFQFPAPHPDRISVLPIRKKEGGETEKTKKEK
jgi:hypothetical protein